MLVKNTSKSDENNKKQINRIIYNNYLVPNWYKQRWHEIGTLQFDFQATATCNYFTRFIKWLNNSKIEKKAGGAYAVGLVIHILKKMITYRGRYEFNSLNDIKKFISKKLKLSNNYVKASYLIKAIFISYKQYIKKKCKNENPYIFDYFYTV